MSINLANPVIYRIAQLIEEKHGLPTTHQLMSISYIFQEVLQLPFGFRYYTDNIVIEAYSQDVEGGTTWELIYSNWFISIPNELGLRWRTNDSASWVKSNQKYLQQGEIYVEKIQDLVTLIDDVGLTWLPFFALCCAKLKSGETRRDIHDYIKQSCSHWTLSMAEREHIISMSKDLKRHC